jgi:thiol-disulfide isomerase/thioredoxin
MFDQMEILIPGQSKGFKNFPYGILVLGVFSIFITAIQYTLLFSGSLDRLGPFIPYVGGVPAAPYQITCFLAIYYCIAQQRKILYLIASPLLFYLCIGVVDVFKPALEHFGNPWLMVSPWRPLWSIALPAFWLMIVLRTLRWKYRNEVRQQAEGVTIDRSKEFMGKFSDKGIVKFNLIYILCGCALYWGIFWYFTPVRKAHTHAEPIARIGAKPPDFIVTTLDGAVVSTGDLHGKVTLLNFWATWCGPCLAEMPRLEAEIWKKFKSRNFTMVALAYEETGDEISAFLKGKDYSFPTAPDPQGEIFRRFANQGIPRNFVVGADGTIIYQSLGYQPKEFDAMTRVIEAELAKAEKPAPASR